MVLLRLTELIYQPKTKLIIIKIIIIIIIIKIIIVIIIIIKNNINNNKKKKTKTKNTLTGIGCMVNKAINRNLPLLSCWLIDQNRTVLLSLVYSICHIIANKKLLSK